MAVCNNFVHRLDGQSGAWLYLNRDATRGSEKLKVKNEVIFSERHSAFRALIYFLVLFFSTLYGSCGMRKANIPWFVKAIN